MQIFLRQERSWRPEQCRNLGLPQPKRQPCHDDLRPRHGEFPTTERGCRPRRGRFLRTTALLSRANGRHIFCFTARKALLVDETNGDYTGLEAEANEWASNVLVPQRKWEQFIATSPRSERAVEVLADEQGIAPGIVVGMLQHKGLLPWSHLNGLKVRLTWKETK